MRRALVNRLLAAVAVTAVVLLAGAGPAGALSRDPFQPTGAAATVAAGSGGSTATTAAASPGGSTTSPPTTAAAQGGGSGGTTATTAPAQTGTPGTTAGSAGATATSSSSLPVTGSRTSEPLLLGLVSLVLGGGLAYVGRRRWDSRRYVRC